MNCLMDGCRNRAERGEVYCGKCLGLFRYMDSGLNDLFRRTSRSERPPKGYRRALHDDSWYDKY